MTETIITKSISKENLQALHKADHICFDHSPEGFGIRAIIRAKKPYLHDYTVDVPVAFSHVRIYDKNADYGTRNGKMAKCFALIYNYNEVWMTFLSLLHAGDQIKLNWQGSQGSSYLSRATVTEKDSQEGYSPGFGEHLYHDRLYIEIWRKEKRKYYLYLDDSICPNNSARMIKP